MPNILTEYDTSTIITTIFGASVTIVAALAFARDWLKSRVLTDTNRDAAINGVEINQAVLRNLQEEVARLNKRVFEVEAKVEELTHKLANVRMVAIDCYSIASNCDCANTENKRKLLEHLKQIIRDS